MKYRPGRLTAAVSSLALGVGILAVAPAQAAPEDVVRVSLIGVNDFHGRIDPNTVAWASTIEQVRASTEGVDSLMISAGDNIGASLFASSIQNDEPTIEVLNEIGLDASVVGNHEFDKGFADLVERVIPAADFDYIGANVKKSDGSDALDPYAMYDIDGLKVAVVGGVTEETPSLVDPQGVAGLKFGDPVDAVNDAVDAIDALPEDQQPDVIVASYHEGAPDGSMTLEQAIAQSLVFKKIVDGTSPEVDAIFTGHTHQKYTYQAPIPGQAGKTRPVLQTGSYGDNIGHIVLAVDTETGEITTETAENVARLAQAPAELTERVTEVKDTVDAALAFADEKGSEKLGDITADITRAYKNGSNTRDLQSTLGSVVADSLLDQVGGLGVGADIGLTNPGGLRADLLYAGEEGSETNTNGVVTLAEANAVQPFQNTLASVSMTGEVLKEVLEQQWQRDAEGNVPSRPYLQLGLSSNLTYTADPTLPEGDRITSIYINDKLVDLDATYKVAVPSFLANGGDNFRAFTKGTATETGVLDYEAWFDYIRANSPVKPDYALRALKVEGLESEYQAGDQVSFTLPELNMTSLGAPTPDAGTVRLVKPTGGEIVLDTFGIANGAATVSFALPTDFSSVDDGAMMYVSTNKTGTKVWLPPVTIYPAEFEDVSDDPKSPVYNLFFEPITWLVEQGITRGFDNGDGSADFMPKSMITRDAMAAFLFRAVGDEEYKAPEESHFSDVSTDNRFYREISWLYDSGLSTGWAVAGSKPEFRGSSKITRDAMAAFLFRYADPEGYEAPTVSNFSDVAPSSQFYEAINWMFDAEISTGWDGPGDRPQYRPRLQITREAMAAFLYRLLADQ